MRCHVDKKDSNADLISVNPVLTTQFYACVYARFHWLYDCLCLVCVGALRTLLSDTELIVYMLLRWLVYVFFAFHPHGMLRRLKQSANTTHNEAPTAATRSINRALVFIQNTVRALHWACRSWLLLGLRWVENGNQLLNNIADACQRLWKTYWHKHTVDYNIGTVLNIRSFYIIL